MSYLVEMPKWLGEHTSKRVKVVANLALVAIAALWLVTGEMAFAVLFAAAVIAMFVEGHTRWSRRNG